MFHLVSRIIFVASLIRVAAAVVLVGAIGQGVYLIFSGMYLYGLIWVVTAVVCGWVGNMLYNLIRVLGSASAGPTAQSYQETNLNSSSANRNRYRGLHTSMSSRKAR